MTLRKYWPLGFLGFLGFIGISGVLHGDVLQSIWIFWFALFAWFVPEKKEGAAGDK